MGCVVSRIKQHLPLSFQRQGLQAASGDVLSRWEKEMRDKLVSYLQQEEHKPMPPE